MCGIAGIADFHNIANSISTIESMLRAIGYRGPDESGIYHSRIVTLGNVRLSIIDPNGGQQPLSDPTGRFWIVYNGEIFNYKELRTTLEKSGTAFITQSDTEVLVNLYAKHGKKCLNMLNGQFAFAIWDKLKEELFLARDRVGIRPLFYNIHNRVFSFASEIKALFQQESVSREFNQQGISQVFTFWATLTPGTPFKGIYELPPGHCAVLNSNGLQIEKYWTLHFESAAKRLSLNEAMEQFQELFSNAVRLRLRSDVAVAAYLSGGIDSCATVAHIKEMEPGILNTFSIGFDDKNFDESNYQREAADYYGTIHRSMICSSGDIAESFPKVIWHAETPLTRTAPVPMLMLSQLVRKSNIKVVITGEGSDEFLGGYDIFKEAIIRRFWASQPDSAIRPLLLKKLYPDLPHLKQASPNILKMFFGYHLTDITNPFYSHLLRWNNSNHIKKHFSSHLKNDLSGYSPLDQLAENLPDNFATWDPLSQSQWLEATIFMSGYLLSSQGDRMTMANSVEGRYPFLDYRLIEFCGTLPHDYKLKGVNEKYLLKKALMNKIPDSILSRPKKPYRAPIRNVFLSKNPPEYVKAMLSEEYTNRVGVFSFNSLNSVLSRLKTTGISSEVDDMLLTSVISTHLLYYQFIENNNEEYRGGALKNLRIIDETRIKST